jgi:glycopeptide antibiotics resistance protein
MAASLVVVALLTLTPRGSGWAWGSPLVEARWYLTGLDSTATMLQLAGNLLLLVVPFGLAAARWRALGRLRLLTVVSLAAGSTIELLQWALPLGRVVSPLDAVLNATGAVCAALVVVQVRAVRPGNRYSRSSTSQACQGTTPSTAVRPTLES